METTWRITEADRDSEGNIKLNATTPAEPRSLADLLPQPETIKRDAARQRLTRSEAAGLAAVALLAVAIMAYARATPDAPPAAPRPAATAVPTLAPTSAPTAAPATPVRLLAAFAAPDGATLGTIEATRPYTVTAHYGSDWLQAQVEGSGLIWLRAADLPGVALAGPDLAPRRPQPAPVAQPVAAPASAPAPCTRDIAPYTVHRQVLQGTLPIGEVSGWSCTSAAEAEANASAQEQQVRASYQATVTTKTAEAR